MFPFRRVVSFFFTRLWPLQSVNESIEMSLVVCLIVKHWAKIHHFEQHGRKIEEISHSCWFDLCFSSFSIARLRGRRAKRNENVVVISVMYDNIKKRRRRRWREREERKKKEKENEFCNPTLSFIPNAFYQYYKPHMTWISLSNNSNRDIFVSLNTSFFRHRTFRYSLEDKVVVLERASLHHHWFEDWWER